MNELELNFDTAQGPRQTQWGINCGLCVRFVVPLEESVPPGFVGGSLAVRQPGLALDFNFACFGWDLRQFADSLRLLHQRANGQAEFSNQEETVRLRLRYEDFGRGTISVDLGLTYFRCGPFSEDPFTSELEFGEFGIEQTELLRHARAIEELLRYGGVDSRHPMEMR